MCPTKAGGRTPRRSSLWWAALTANSAARVCALPKPAVLDHARYDAAASVLRPRRYVPYCRLTSCYSGVLCTSRSSLRRPPMHFVHTTGGHEGHPVHLRRRLHRPGPAGVGADPRGVAGVRQPGETQRFCPLYSSIRVLQLCMRTASLTGHGSGNSRGERTGSFPTTLAAFRCGRGESPARSRTSRSQKMRAHCKLSRCGRGSQDRQLCS